MKLKLFLSIALAFYLYPLKTLANDNIFTNTHIPEYITPNGSSLASANKHSNYGNRFWQNYALSVSDLAKAQIDDINKINKDYRKLILPYQERINGLRKEITTMEMNKTSNDSLTNPINVLRAQINLLNDQIKAQDEIGDLKVYAVLTPKQIESLKAIRNGTYIPAPPELNFALSQD